MIRTAKLEDSDSINALSEDLGYPGTPPDEARARLNHLLESATDDVCLFEESGKVLGWIHTFIAYRVASPAFYEIGGLVVGPDARNRGIGRKLVEFAGKQSRSNNLELRVRCNSKRLDTHKFYEKTGFIESKTQCVFKLNS